MVEGRGPSVGEGEGVGVGVGLPVTIEPAFSLLTMTFALLTP